jgi:hypothetical protein
VVLVALACTATAAAAKPAPEGGLIPGVVNPPPFGLTLRDDVIAAPPGAAIAAAPPVPGVSEEFTTASGAHVKVKIVAGYTPDPAYSQSVVAFLDSLLHGAELDGLTVFVVLPEEMRATCGGPAAACYFPKRNTMYIVGEASYGGFSTSYVVAHEYGHRIAHFRRNPPFPGGALAWGTKRWASQERVCRKTVQGEYAPGSQEGRDYYRNPGEAFAEAYAWYHYGSELVGWEYASSLRPNAASFAAIERDVLEPWAPTKFELKGSLSRPRARKVYPLRIENDGWVKVQISGGGDLDIGLLDSRGRFIAVSIKPGTARDRLNFLACGERKLKLVVEDVRLPGEYRLQVSQP